MSATDPERARLAGPPARPRRPLGERIRDEDSYGLLLLLILLSLLLTGLVGEGRLGRLVLTASSGAMALFAFWTSRPDPRVMRWVVVLVSLSMVAAGLALLVSGTALEARAGH
jgi:hypothetical protein